MIGLQSLHIKPALLRKYGAIDSLNGYWNGLDDYTTGLNLLGDVASHGHRLKAMLGPLQNKALTIDIICGLHKAFGGAGEGAGQLKTQDNTLTFTHDGVQLGALDTAAPADVQPLLSKLLTWADEALLSDDYHPLLIIAVFSAIFLQIAPFASGNQRLVRFLMMLLMLKAGYRYAPFASLEDAFDAHAAHVYEALQAQQQSIEDGAPDWQAWLTCFADVLLAQIAPLKAQLQGQETSEQILATTDMPELSIKLLDVIRTHKRATMKELIAGTQGRRSTIKLRMQELVHDGLVKRHGAGRGVWYSLV